MESVITDFNVLDFLIIDRDLSLAISGPSSNDLMTNPFQGRESVYDRKSIPTAPPETPYTGISYYSVIKLCSNMLCVREDL